MTTALTQKWAIEKAIHANLDVLASILTACVMSAAEGRSAMADGKLTLAIGAVLPLEKTLPECDALVRATIALARFQTGEDGRLL